MNEVELLRHRYERTSNAPVTATPIAVTGAAEVLAAANTDRINITIQNCGQEPLIVNLGGTASAAAYHHVLSACTADRDGLGASITIENYTGAISGFVEANSTIAAVLELTNVF